MIRRTTGLRIAGYLLAGLTLAALALLAIAAFQTPLLAQARPNDPSKSHNVLHLPGMEKARVHADLPYRGEGDSLRTFDLYLPAKVSASAPVSVVLFFNLGANWETPLPKWGIYREWAQLVAASGMAAVLMNTGPGRGVGDAKALVAELRKQAKTYRLDLEHLGLWACSMHVTEGLKLAMDPAQPFRAAVIYYGVTDTSAMNPERPVMMVRAGLDAPNLNQAMGAWASKAIRIGAPLTWVDLPTQHHAFDAFDDDELSRATVRQTLEFLRFELSEQGVAARAARATEREVESHLRAGQWSNAIAALEKWIAAEPNNGEAHRMLGDALYRTDGFARAAVAYEKAGDLGAQPARTWYNAACCYARQGEKEKALGLLEKAFATGQVRDKAAVQRDTDLSSLVQEPRFKALFGAQ